jgi:hypothetical protein
MNDLERDLRELLQHKADEGWAQPEAPVRLLRRVRQRQAVAAVVAGVAAALVGLASFAGVRAVLDPDGADTPAAPTTTRTLNGITIEYPEGWFLADPRTLEGTEFGQDSLLILANRAANPAEALGCPGLAVERPMPAVIPDVLMTVEGRPTGGNGSTWPAHLEPLQLDSLDDSTCYQGWHFRSARWVAQGHLYEAVVGFAPSASADDQKAMDSAFNSMRFPLGPVPPTPGRTVIAEGTAAGERWELIVRSTDEGLELELGYPSGGSAMTGPFAGDVPLVAWTPLVLGEGPSAEVVAFGLVSPEVAQVSVTVPGFAGPAAEILDIPDEIAPDLQAFVATVPVGVVTVRVRDAGGNVLDEQTVDPEEGSTSVPTAPEQQAGDPPVDPVAPDHGGTYWGAYLWVGTAEDAEQVGFETGDWLRERGFPYSAGDLSCDQPVDGSIGDPGEDWRIAVYFDTHGNAREFVDWYVETRFPGGDPVSVPIEEIRTYCLD